MKLSVIGDLAQASLLRRDMGRVKTDLFRLTGELTSGRTAALNTVLQGQFGPLAGIGRSLALAEAYIPGNEAAARFSAAQQMALGAVQDIILPAGPDLVASATLGNDMRRNIVVGQASRQFEQVISALNTQIEGKALFGGAALDGAAMARADIILSHLEGAIAGLTDPDAVLTAVRTWFDAPGNGFDDVAYLGATVPLTDKAIGSGESVSLDITASDPALRDALRGLALGALLDRGLFASDGSAHRAVLRDAGETLLAAGDRLIERRADLGSVEARIAAARVRGDAEITALRMARAALVDADPYDTAMRLQEVQTQLETIYAVTARVANLSLAKVLR